MVEHDQTTDDTDEQTVWEGQVYDGQYHNDQLLLSNREAAIGHVSYPRFNSWACQWDSRVSCSHTKAPCLGLSNPGLSQGLSARDSEGLVRCPLTSGLADGQPVPPTTSGSVGRIFILEPKSNQAYALAPTSSLVGFRAVTAVILALEEYGIKAEESDFKQVSDRLWKASFGEVEGQVMRPKIFDSVAESREGEDV